MFIRKARLTDVEAMHQLVNNYAEKGLMLSRSRSMLYEYIRDFAVAEVDGEVVGTGALHIMWVDLAEIRAVAIKEGFTGQKIGKQLIEFFLQEARELGIPRVFTLTYQPGFFKKSGFTVVSKESMPQKVWRECINCPKFPNCDEVCMEFVLRQC
ncbi:MAG: N-acetyltransferase [Peptococcaceae bacterium]|jgi:amino-acid N-acetyltransferase|nr:N-acetyltransferase [Peptococcaceae bacterium]MDH7524348.1 N-acetyltransferase [Peptococcaceae bacterium]